MECTEIAIFGLGTLGDILPLITLSVELLNIYSTNRILKIFFVTNAAHRSHVEKHFPNHGVTNRRKQFFSAEYVSNSPLNLNPHEVSFLSMDEINLISEKMALNDNLALVVANLFCLTGWLVAEKLGVRCILLHPHKPHSERPSSFLSSLKRSAPYFHRRILSEEDDGHCADLALLATENKHSTILWQDYEEWLWPTLSSFYDSTRQKLKLKDVSSPSYVPPLNPVVLLAISPYFYPVPGYWPADRYIVSGMISQDQVSEKYLDIFDESLLADLSALLSLQEYPIICIEFGSMTELLIQQYDWGVFCATIQKVQCFSFLILCHQHHATVTEFFEDSDDASIEMKDEKFNRISECLSLFSNVILVGGHVRHASLFKRCAAVLHHGGVGTMGAALHSGIPQHNFCNSLNMRLILISHLPSPPKSSDCDSPVIMPLIHDQHSNAERLEYLGYAPPSLPRKVLFPHTLNPIVSLKCVSDSVDLGAVKTVGEEEVDNCFKSTMSHILSEDGEKIDDTRERSTEDHAHELQLSDVTANTRRIQKKKRVRSNDEQEVVEPSVSLAAAAAVLHLARLLRLVTAPPHRLKCACLGRDLRANPLENGLKNCCAIILEEIRIRDDITCTENVLDSSRGTSEVSSDSCSGANIIDGAPSDEKEATWSGKNTIRLEKGREEAEEIDEEDGTDWQDYPGGLRLATHHLTAPEETNFLYEEIFEQRTYMQHGIKLNEDDLVIDVGANIGFFSVFVELQFDTPNALDIIAIEPCQENFKLLKKNLRKYAPRATIFQCAVLNLEKCSATDFAEQRWKQDGIPYNMSDSAQRAAKNGNEVLTEHPRLDMSLSPSATTSGCDAGRACCPPNLSTSLEDHPLFQQSHNRKRKISYCQPQVAKALASESIMMTFYPRMPGNSLTIARAEKNTFFGKRDIHVCDNRLHLHESPYLVGAVQQKCSARTLSSIMDEWDSMHGPQVAISDENEGGEGPLIATREKSRRRIGLIKIDVEGSELEVLLSLELRHWALVDQVVVETARPPGMLCATNLPPSRDVEQSIIDRLPPKNVPTLEEGMTTEEESNLDVICSLLRNLGFKISIETDPGRGTDTGCFLIFALRCD